MTSRLEALLGGENLRGSLDVEQQTAGPADEVVMGCDVGVIPRRAAARPGLEPSFRNQELQVAVDGAERNARHLAPNPLVHPFGRRMRFRRGDRVVHEPSLTCLPTGGCIHISNGYY